MKSRILVIGPVETEMVCPVDAYPAPQTTVYGENYQSMPGGKGLVAAMTLGEMGLEAILCSVLGEDGEGMAIRSFCRAIGLDTRFLATMKEAHTALSLTMVDAEAQRHTIRYRGVIDLMKKAHVEDGATSIPDAIYLQEEISEPLIRFAAKYAEQRGIPAFLDLGDACPVSDYKKLGRFEIVTASQDEVERLTSLPLRTQDEIMHACLQLAKIIDSRYYVIKLAERGSILFDGTYYHLVTAYEAEVEDNRGVGDIYSSILVAEYLKTGDIRRAMEYASAGAALSVMKKGTVASIPEASDIERIVSETVGEYQ